jgi:hypothetical protein
MDTLWQVLIGIGLGAVLLGLIMFIGRVDSHLQEMTEKLRSIDARLESYIESKS